MKKPTTGRGGGLARRHLLCYLPWITLLLLESSIIPIYNTWFSPDPSVWSADLQLAFLPDRQQFITFIITEWTLICLFSFGIGVWTAVVIRSHMRGNTGDGRLRHSANTVMMLSANTLAFSVYIVVIDLLYRKDVFREKEGRDPAMWKSMVFWVPLILNTLTSPLILIKRNRISVRGTLSRSMDSHVQPTPEKQTLSGKKNSEEQ